MKVLKNTNKIPKLILISVMLILFSFIFSPNVNASIGDDICAAPAKILFWAEKGILTILNNKFVEGTEYEATIQTDGSIRLYLTPENIIKGRFLIFDADIFKKIDSNSAYNENTDRGYIDYDGRENTEDNAGGNVAIGKKALRETISGWYYSLRDFSIIALLSVLVYVAIRMILSTVAQDKAKYKAMFKDWIVALCLLMLMHYAMISILQINSLIVDALGGGESVDTISEISSKISAVLYGSDTSDPEDDYEEDFDGVKMTLGDAYAYILVLIAVIVYMVIFAIKYFKREFTIIFLILLGPISCITYPIDKISDGKAQAFNKWFAEFLYQVIIQPFHLLLYIVLIGSATELAKANFIYAIMCFAVMIPAEKFVKEMFGFKDKLGSPLGAFAGGAMASQLFNKMKGGNNSNSNNQSNNIKGQNDEASGIRENKLNPGMPGEDEGNGQPANYEANDSLPEGNDNQLPGENDDVVPNNDDTESSPQQDMLDTYDENFGTPDWNPQERDAMANDANDGQGMDYSNEEYEQILRDSGYSQEEIDDIMGNNNPGEGGDEAEEESEGDDDGTNESDTDDSDEQENETNGIYSPNEQGNSKFKNRVNSARQLMRERRSAKYGTRSFLKARAVGLGRKGASVAKKSIKGAATLSGAIALGGIGMMFGKGKEGFALGAGLGSKVGKGINNAGSKAFANARDYGREMIYAGKNEEERRKARVDKLKNNPNELRKAAEGFSKRNNGRYANSKELEQELVDRAKFKEAKLTDSQIDDAMKIYSDNKSVLGDDGAFQMAYTSAKIADRYSAKDFEDPSKMKNAYNGLMENYRKLGVSQDLADENVRSILENAAGIYGVKEPALPVPSRRDMYKKDKNNIQRAKASYASRHSGAKPNKQQLDQELEMGYSLRKGGITNDEDVNRFFNEYLTNSDAIEEAKNSVGEDASEEVINNELERRFEIKIKAGIDDEKELSTMINSSTEFIKENKGIDNPTNGQVFTEVKQQLTVRDSYHISSTSQAELTSQINEIRKDEEKFVEKSTDKDGARVVLNAQRKEAERAPASSAKEQQSKAKYQREFLASYSTREMQDPKIMERAKKKIMKKLEANNQGVFSLEAKEQFADEVISSSKIMSGIDT